MSQPGYLLRIRTIAATALLLCVFLSACSVTEPEQQLRDAVDAMETAVDARNPADFMQYVAEDFTGNGNIDRAAMHNLLRAQLLRNASIGITRGPLAIELQGERAKLDFSLVLTGGAGGLLPERAQAYQIETGWRRDGDEWRMFLVQWTPMR